MNPIERKPKQKIILFFSLLLTTLAILLAILSADNKKALLAVENNLPNSTVTVTKTGAPKPLIETTDQSFRKKLQPGEYLIRSASNEKEVLSYVNLTSGNEILVNIKNYEQLDVDHISDVYSFKLSAKGKLLAMVDSRDSSFLEMSEVSPYPKKIFSPLNVASRVELLDDSYLIVSGAFQAYIYKNRSLSLIVDKAGAPITVADYSYDGENLYMLGQDGLYQLANEKIKTTSSKQIKSTLVATLPASALELSSSNGLVLAYGNSLDVDDPEARIELKNVFVKSGEVLDQNNLQIILARLSPSSDKIIYVDEDGSSWLAATPDIKKISRVPSQEPLDIYWRNEENVLLAAFSGLWQYNTKDNLLNLLIPRPATAVAINDYGIFVTLGGDGGGLYLYSDKNIWNNVLQDDILSRLPHRGVMFNIDYRLKDGSTSDFVLQITPFEEASKELALLEIRYWGFNPEDYEIEYLEAPN